MAKMLLCDPLCLLLPFGTGVALLLFGLLAPLPGPLLLLLLISGGSIVCCWGDVGLERDVIEGTAKGAEGECCTLRYPLLLPRTRGGLSSLCDVDDWREWLAVALPPMPRSWA